MGGVWISQFQKPFLARFSKHFSIQFTLDLFCSVLFLNAVQNDDVAGVRDLAPSVGQEELNYALMRAAIIGNNNIVYIVANRHDVL